MKGNDSSRKQLRAGFMAGIAEGTVAVPYILLQTYRSMRLTEAETMLLIHIMAFGEKERKEFPTLEELQQRMSGSPEAVIAALQRLMKGGFVTIDEHIEPVSGIRYERYNLHPLYEKLADVWLEQLKAREAAAASAPSGPGRESGKDLFSIFENEFGRPLTPMEMETISGWLDQDRYKEELILAALKEAVFAGKVHFKYIDRILLDWGRNRVSTVQQAKEYSQKFRSTR
jgi:DNA replication protein